MSDPTSLKPLLSSLDAMFPIPAAPTPILSSTAPLVRTDSDAKVDCGPGGGGCGPSWGMGNNGEWTPREWVELGPGLSMEEIDRLVGGDAILYRMVTKIVVDAMSTDVLPTLTGKTIKELNDCISWLETRSFFEAATQAQIYAREYGGGAVLCCVEDDSKSNAEEIDISKVYDVVGFIAIPKRYCTPADVGSGNTSTGWYGPRWGKPEHYNVTSPVGTAFKGGTVFHRSRVIPWQYMSNLDLRQARKYPHWNGWGPGIVEVCLAPWMSRRNGMLRLDDILNGSHMNVLKIPSLLTGMSTPDGGQAVRNTLEWIKECLAITGRNLPIVGIDGASELTAESHNLSGVDKLAGEQRRHFIDSTEYPEVVLFSSGGATGLSGDSNEGQWRSYFATVKAFQQSWIWKGGTQGGGIRQAVILAMAAKCGPTKGQIDLTVKANWPSLWVDSDQSRAETRLKDCQARASDAVLLGMSPAALIRLDDTIRKSYPGIEIDDGSFPTFSNGEIGAPSAALAENGKAASTPIASMNAAVEEIDSALPQQTQSMQDEAPVLPPQAAWPTDFVTETDLQSALQMSRASLRKWMSTQEGIVPFPTAKGTKGGHRYSLSQVLGAWQAGAKARVDALRKSRG